jgi:hypothetical protein
MKEMALDGSYIRQERVEKVIKMLRRAKYKADIKLGHTGVGCA